MFRFLGYRRDPNMVATDVTSERELDTQYSLKHHNIGRRFIKRTFSLACAMGLIMNITPNLVMLTGFGANHASAFISDQDDYLYIMSDEGFYGNSTQLLSQSGNYEGMNGVIPYTVQQGDTVGGIANKFGISSATVIRTNGLANANSIRVGSKLAIPSVDGSIVTVQKGDTIEKLATKHKIKAEDILKYNNLEENELVAGETIVLPGVKLDTVIVNRNIPAASGPYVSNQTYVENGQKFVWPTVGKVTQGFVAGHYAIDIGNRSRPAVFASASGKVIKAAIGWNGGYGNHIIVDHGNGVQTLYAHMQKLNVVTGQEVARGEIIGQMGNTGKVYGATGIHLHFEVRINGIKKNPMAYFK